MNQIEMYEVKKFDQLFVIQISRPIQWSLLQSTR